MRLCALTRACPRFFEKSSVYSVAPYVCFSCAKLFGFAAISAARSTRANKAASVTLAHWATQHGQAHVLRERDIATRYISSHHAPSPRLWCAHGPAHSDTQAVFSQAHMAPAAWQTSLLRAQRC